MPPLVGEAVNVTAVPAHIVPDGDAEILTAGTSTGFTVIVIVFDVAVTRVVQTAFGGITVDSGTAALSSVQVGTGFGYYPIYSSSFNIPSLPLSAGTYWLQLQNAVTTNGSHVYWDINYGPSTAYLQPYGYGTYAIGSESFQVTATPTPIPAALWLVGSGLAGVFGFARRKAGKDTQA